MRLRGLSSREQCTASKRTLIHDLCDDGSSSVNARGMSSMTQFLFFHHARFWSHHQLTTPSLIVPTRSVSSTHSTISVLPESRAQARRLRRLSPCSLSCKLGISRRMMLCVVCQVLWGTIQRKSLVLYSEPINSVPSSVLLLHNWKREKHNNNAQCHGHC